MIDQNTDNRKDMKKTQNIARFYMFLSVLAVIIMIIAAYITYGYQKREFIISLGSSEKVKEESVNDINVAPDLSRIPSDDMIEDILNDVLPEVCDDCDDDTLDCLDEYEINKIFVQNEGYQDQLIIEVITGKNNAVYTVVLDLNSYAVLSSDGVIDDEECLEDPEDEDVDPEILLDPGDDSEKSHYLDVPELE